MTWQSFFITSHLTVDGPLLQYRERSDRMTSWTSSVGLKIAPLSVASGRCARGTVLSVASGRYARGTVLRYLAKLSQRPSDDLPDMTLIVRVRIDALNGVISKFGSGALSFPDTKALTTTIVDD